MSSLPELRIRRKPFILLVLLIAALSAVMIFAHHNAFLYKKTIVRVTAVKTMEQAPVQDWHGNKDRDIRQRLTGVILNGKHSGESVRLINDYTASQAYSQKYNKGMDIFIHLDTKISGTWKGSITGVKRDAVILTALTVFLFLLFSIGKRQGGLSILSLLGNMICVSAALDFYLSHRNFNLLLIFLIAVFICTMVSLILVSGFCRKTWIVAAASVITTWLSLGLASLAIALTSGNGIHYDPMEFVTLPPENIFLSGLLIGALGAIMDVAMTLASSMEELYVHQPAITRKQLRQAGFSIGRDIMGVMTNILLFAYISGSIPMIILSLKNGFPLTYAFSLNISLEIVRALVGGIGIVLTIPVTIYLTLYVLFRKEGETE